MDSVRSKLESMGFKILSYNKSKKGMASGKIVFEFEGDRYSIDWDVAIYLFDAKSVIKNSENVSG